MVVLVLDAAGQHIVSLHLKPLTVAVLGLYLDMLGALDSAVMAGKRQASLVQFHLLIAQLKDLWVDELDELVLVVSGDLLGQVTVIQADEQTAHHAHLRASQPQAVGGDQGLFHIVQQGAEAGIKFRDGAADFFQNRVSVLYNGAKCHG